MTDEKKKLTKEEKFQKTKSLLKEGDCKLLNDDEIDSVVGGRASKGNPGGRIIRYIFDIIRGK